MGSIFSSAVDKYKLIFWMVKLKLTTFWRYWNCESKVSSRLFCLSFFLEVLEKELILVVIGNFVKCY